jgi:hypothetical protein
VDGRPGPPDEIPVASSGRDFGNAKEFLYLDGHVRAYPGKRTLPKAHVARMRYRDAGDDGLPGPRRRR